MRWDAIVVGAGVVGLACAERLARDRRSVLLLERHESFGRETSSRNSQVIHAGLYYPEGSWKARLCVEGRHRLHAWCARHRVEARAIGAIAGSAAGRGCARSSTRCPRPGSPGSVFT